MTSDRLGRCHKSSSGLLRVHTYCILYSDCTVFAWPASALTIVHNLYSMTLKIINLKNFYTHTGRCRHRQKQTKDVTYKTFSTARCPMCHRKYFSYYKTWQICSGLPLGSRLAIMFLLLSHCFLSNFRLRLKTRSWFCFPPVTRTRRRRRTPHQNIPDRIELKVWNLAHRLKLTRLRSTLFSLGRPGVWLEDH